MAILTRRPLPPIMGASSGEFDRITSAAIENLSKSTRLIPRETSTAGSSLGLFAIIGIAIGAGTLLFVVSFITLYMCLRGRRRKQVALARKVSRVYPGGNMSMDCDPKPQAHMSFHEQGWPIGRQHTTLSRPGQFSLGPRTMGGRTHTGRHGKYSRLSWSVRPRKSTSLRLPAHDGTRFALSPVIESPLSRSMSSPELSSGVGFGFSLPKSPLIHSESVAQPVVYWQTTITALAKSSPTSPQTIWEAFCVNSFPSPDLSGSTDARPSPKLRSMSENYLPSSPVPDHELQRTASSGTFRFAKSRPLSALVRFNAQQAGSVPEDPPPLLPPEIAAFESNGRRQFSAEKRLSVQDAGSSVASTRSSILLQDSNVPSPIRRASASTTVLPRPASPMRSSGTSDGLSIFNRESSTWDIIPPGGLTSPSRKRRLSMTRKKLNPGVNCHSPARCEVESFTSEQVFIDGSVESLATLIGLGPKHNRQTSTDVFGYRPENLYRRSGESNASIDVVPAPPPSTPQDADKYALQRTSFDTMNRTSSGLTTPKNAAHGVVRLPIRKDSALNEVSGNNQGDPFRNRPASRGRSTSAEDGQKLFRWDSQMARRQIPPISALKDRNGGVQRSKSRRQKSVRISRNAPTVLGNSSCSPMDEEPENNIHGNSKQPSMTPSPRRPNGARPLPRPPAIALLEPQISPTPTRARLGDDVQDQDYSPTMSVFDYYNTAEVRSDTPDDSRIIASPSPSPLLSPPLPVPEHLHLTPAYPSTNIETDIFTDPSFSHSSNPESSMASLVLPPDTLASFPEVPLTSPPHHFTIRPVKGSPPSSSRSARTRAKIPNVASLSSPLANMSLTSTAHHLARNGPYPVRAASAVRGPRTPPSQRFPLSNCKESTLARSDPSPSANISKDSSDLHRSVLALRRMNSEVSDGSSVSHDHTATATATSTIGAGGQPHQRGSSQYYWKLGQTSAEHMRGAMITPISSPTALGSPRATLRSSSSPITTTAAVGRHTFRFQASRSPRRSSSRLNTVQSSGVERQQTAQGREGEMILRMEMKALQTTPSSQRFAARDSKNFEMPSPRSGGEIPVFKGGEGGWLQQAEEGVRDDEGGLETRGEAHREIYHHDGF